MKKVIKWIGISLLGIVILLTITAFVLSARFQSLAKQTYSITPAEIPIPSDSTSLMRGRLLSLECCSCHGYDYAGKDFFNDPTIGYMSSPNLTKAKGSATEHFTNANWVRAIRHGVGHKGNALMVMPSESFCYLSDNDLGSLIAYLNTLEPIEKPQPESKFTFMANIMAGAGMFGPLDSMYPAQYIDHKAVEHVTAPPIGSTLEYGQYMVKFMGCQTCHGKDLNGGKHPDPLAPPVPSISNKGNFGNWSLEQFKSVFRTGRTPEGKTMNPEFMPFAPIGAHSDVELEALYKYIKSMAK